MAARFHQATDEASALGASGTIAPGGLLRYHRVSVIVPTKNEAKNLPHVLPRIPEWVDEVLLVDANSTDGTPDVARQLCPHIRIVQQEGRGKGAALRSGFAAATGDIIVMLDADGSTDPAEIPAFIGPLLAGADFVKGSRYLQGGGSADISVTRSLGNLVFTGLVRFFHGGQYTDLCYGYNAFWARVLPGLALDGDGFEIETIMNLRALQRGLKVIEVPSFEHSRIHGVSNLRTIPDGWRVTKAIWRETWGECFREWSHLARRSAATIDRPIAGAGRGTQGYAVAWSSVDVGTGD